MSLLFRFCTYFGLLIFLGTVLLPLLEYVLFPLMGLSEGDLDGLARLSGVAILTCLLFATVFTLISFHNTRIRIYVDTGQQEVLELILKNHRDAEVDNNGRVQIGDFYTGLILVVSKSDKTIGSVIEVSRKNPFSFNKPDHLELGDTLKS